VSAALPAKLLLNAVAETDGILLDMCAAPGGKTMQLAAAARGKVVAIDRSKARCKRLKENLGRVGGGEVDIVVGDAVEWQPGGGEGGERIKGVLVDAPCSASGIARRHPDLLQSEDREGLGETQVRLLERAIQLLRDGGGGVLVYW
jgi:16S rRNA (cytosine967-C5)-methyltransferase